MATDILTLTGTTITEDESAGLQTGGIVTTVEDYNDDDIASLSSTINTQLSAALTADGVTVPARSSSAISRWRSNFGSGSPRRDANRQENFKTETLPKQQHLRHCPNTKSLEAKVMPRILCAVLFASLSLIALGPTAALAASSETQCTSSGGTFTKENGTATCTFATTTNVGNSPNSQTTTATDTTSGQGNTGNKTSTSSTCTGPGGSTSSAHC
jgi:hypothetical protein